MAIKVNDQATRDFLLKELSVKNIKRLGGLVEKEKSGPIDIKLGLNRIKGLTDYSYSPQGRTVEYDAFYAQVEDKVFKQQLFRSPIATVKKPIKYANELYQKKNKSFEFRINYCFKVL